MKKLLISLMGLGVLWSGCTIENARGQVPYNVTSSEMVADNDGVPLLDKKNIESIRASGTIEPADIKLPSNDDLIRLFKDAGCPVSYTELAKGNPMDIAVGQNFYFVLIQSVSQGQEDSVIVIDKKTGLPKTTWYLGKNGACAATLEGNTLWILSRNRSEFLRSYDLQGVLTKTVAANNIPPGKIYGLALAGGKLYFVVNKDDKGALVEMDRETQECRAIREISGWLPSLTWHHGQLWGWYSDKSATLQNGWLFSLNPAHTEPFRPWRAFSSSLMGLDSDNRILYGLVQRKNGFQIVPFAIWKSPRLLIQSPITRQVTFGKRFKEDSGNKFDLSYFLAQPENKPFQQVTQVKWQVHPTKITADRWGNHWAQINLKGIKRDQEVSVSFVNTSWAVQFQVDISQKFDPKKLPPEIIRTYMRETFSFDISSEQVKTLALKLPVASTWWDKIIGVRNLVNDNLQVVGPSGPWSKASEIIEKGVGRCYGHTVVFCAVGRAAGLPIRAIGGVAIGQDQDNEFPPGTDLNVHTWNQVFIPGQGWVDFDADDNPKGPPHSFRHAGCHTGDYWLTFVGDYDKADYKNVFSQRGWIDGTTKISSTNPSKNISVQSSTIVRVKTLDGAPYLIGQ